MIASAFLALLLLYSCHKERLGQYEPKKKISKIYRSNEKTDRFLAEAWEWDNDRLSKIDHYSTLSYIFSEIYHYNSDGRIASIEDTAHRQLLCLRAQGCRIRQIARALNRSPSTISRELRRNPVRGACSAHEAEKLYRLRRKRCRQAFRLED